MKTVFATTTIMLFSGMLHAQAIDLDEKIDTSGIKIPSGGKVSVIAIGQLPAKAGQVMAGQKKRLDKSSTTSGVLEYTDLEDAHVSDLKRMAAFVKSPAQLADKVLVKLSKLGDEYKDYKLIGLLPEGTIPRGPWTWMSRLFEGPNNTFVRLSEWDFKADDGGILLIKEFLNQEVNGVPATLSLSLAKSGRALWSLTWVRDGKQYTLDLSAPKSVVDHKAKILRLAESLSD